MLDHNHIADGRSSCSTNNSATTVAIPEYQNEAIKIKNLRILFLVNTNSNFRDRFPYHLGEVSSWMIVPRVAIVVVLNLLILRVLVTEKTTNPVESICTFERKFVFRDGLD